MATTDGPVPGRDGAWTWHQDPRAVHKDGVTFVGYVDSDGSVKVYSYNHDDNEELETTLNADLIIDDHVGPAITILNDDRLLVQYARGSSSVRYRISDSPLDISSFEDEQTFSTSDSASYAQSEQLAGGSVVMLYRLSGSGDYEAEYRFSDDLDNWESPIQLTDFGGNRAYVKKARASGDEIYLTVHRANLEDTGDQDFFDVVVFDADNREVRNLDGTLISSESDLPLTASDLGAVDTGENTNPNQMRIWDIVLDGGDPRVLYAKMHNRSAHEYYHAVWDGSNWSTETVLSDAGGGLADGRDYYSGGLSFDHDDPNTAYLSEVEVTFETANIYQYDRANGTWSESEQLTNDSDVLNYRPAPVVNAHSDLPILWLSGQFGGYTDYDTTAESELEVERAVLTPTGSPIDTETLIVGDESTTTGQVYIYDGGEYVPATIISYNA